MNGFISQHDIFIIQLYAITFVAIGFAILKILKSDVLDFILKGLRYSHENKKKTEIFDTCMMDWTHCSITQFSFLFPPWQDPSRKFQEHQPGFGNGGHQFVTGRNLCGKNTIVLILFPGLSYWYSKSLFSYLRIPEIIIPLLLGKKNEIWKCSFVLLKLSTVYLWTTEDTFYLQ